MSVSKECGRPDSDRGAFRYAIDKPSVTAKLDQMDERL